LFPQQFIEDLKHHADIVVVIGDYVSLKKSGATYKGLCPFHGEKTPSFHVNRDKGSSTASAAAWAATCSSSSSCTTRWGLPTP
jgi:hypothetical protein